MPTANKCDLLYRLGNTAGDNPVSSRTIRTMRFKDGEEVGRFIIGRLLGQGGFGEAYLALDKKLQRQVVIKCVRRDLRKSLGWHKTLANEFEKRFWIEAIAQARLSHPNACTVFEVDELNQIIIMEFVDGVTLEEKRAKGPLSAIDLIDIVIAAAEAVADAHAKSVLHRDLTLRNVMLTTSGQVKVLDFGLAKLLDRPPFTSLPKAIGNPPYMSPEQLLRPLEVDARSDVFSFGVVIYRLVTFNYPYHRTFDQDPDPCQPPSFSSFGVDPWPELNSATLQALQLRPEDRFQTMQDFLDELLRVRHALTEAQRDLHFFDTSTLLEVLCPATPTKDGKMRSKRAKKQFEIQHAAKCATTSATVMAELVEEVFKLYFDAESRGLKSATLIQDIVANAKKDIAIARKRGGRNANLSWDKLSWDEKRVFLSRAKGLFQPRLEALASQLVSVPANNAIFISRLFELAIDLRLDQRDAWVLAEVFSFQAAWVFSEEPRYLQSLYRSVLRQHGPNLYRLGDHLEDPPASTTITPPGDRSRSGRRKREGRATLSTVPIKY